MPRICCSLFCQFELRRLPPRGQENITEPLFFALPPEDESPVIAGRWKCVGTRGDDSPVYPDFEIASHGTNLAVRFDQGSEYRFAFVTQASFISNRIEMRIENVADRYEMTGSLNGGRLRGTWRHVDGRESGTWHAERDLPPFVSTGRSAALYEWRSDTGLVRYRLESDEVAGSTRAKTPLCRVWRAQ